MIISFIKVKIQKLQKPFQELPDNILEPFEASKHSKSSFEDKVHFLKYQVYLDFNVVRKFPVLASAHS